MKIWIFHGLLIIFLGSFTIANFGVNLEVVLLKNAKKHMEEKRVCVNFSVLDKIIIIKHVSTEEVCVTSTKTSESAKPITSIAQSIEFKGLPGKYSLPTKIKNPFYGKRIWDLPEDWLANAVVVLGGGGLLAGLGWAPSEMIVVLGLASEALPTAAAP